MQGVFLPEIENYADKDPILYEILLQLSTAVGRVPISAGGAISTGPSGTSADQSSGQQVTNPTENPLYLATDPNGNASGLFLFGGSWQPLARIVKDADISPSAVCRPFLKKGAALLAGVQFDSQGRPSSSFFSNMVDIAGSPTTQPLTQSGTSTTILIAATTWQFGDHQISYNSGSVNPGSFGTFDVYADDPQHNGGVLVFSAVATPSTTPLAVRGRLYFGRITTAGGGGGSGSGGGTGGGRGGGFF